MPVLNLRVFAAAQAVAALHADAIAAYLVEVLFE
jgi:hypothetical protein